MLRPPLLRVPLPGSSVPGVLSFRESFCLSLHSPELRLGSTMCMLRPEPHYLFIASSVEVSSQFRESLSETSTPRAILS